MGDGALPVPRQARARDDHGPPLAIPTLVTGVMILVLYGPNSCSVVRDDLGIQVVFTPIAILIALCTVTLPMVVRTVQPVLQELDPAEEEAAGPRRSRHDDLPAGGVPRDPLGGASRARC